MTADDAAGAAAPNPDEAQRAIEYCYDQGWSDGLPLVPVSLPLLDAFLATTDKDPDEIIGALEQVGRDVNVRTAAINAAMAGCKPEYFPVVLAAFEALMRERAARGGGFQSTSGPSPLIVVNGPVRKELGFNTAGGAFGPGFRPNMTIPRAIGLMVRNAFGIHPHVFEQATQGVPGRWSICVAENEEESPWAPLAADAGVTGGVSAVSCTLTTLTTTGSTMRMIATASTRCWLGASLPNSLISSGLAASSMMAPPPIVMNIRPANPTNHPYVEFTSLELH